MKNKLFIFSVALIYVIAVFAVNETITYFTYRSEAPLETVYTLSQGISVEIDEGGWDEENARNLLPGSTVVQEPALKNTSKGNMPVYGAIRLTFIKGNGQVLTKSEYDSYIAADDNITFSGLDGTVWEADPMGLTASVVYFYKKGNGQIPTGIKTEPIFNEVIINGSIEALIIERYDAWNGFNIRVEGATVQSGLEFAQGTQSGEFENEYEYAKALLRDLFSSSVRRAKTV